MPAKTRASTRSRGSKGPPPRRSAKALAQNPFLALLADVRRDVDTRLAGLLDAKLDALVEHGPEVADMVRALREFCLRGGKRLRAALVVAGYRAATTSEDLEPALDAGVAVELLHAYFLIHDDWMDQDDVRRGGPSVHAHLSRHYRSSRLGEYAAVLVGDLGAGFATEALSRVELPASRLPRVLAAFAQMQTDAVAGQQLDILGGTNIEKTYELKTGSYTVAGPLRMGALLGGGSDRLVTALERLAVPAGVAFQLRDDLLSVFGDPKDTGKPFANDVKSGKRTLVVTRALELATKADRRFLERAWGNPKATLKDLTEAVAILDRSGARAAVEERIGLLTQEALGAVAAARLPEPRARLLSGAIRALVERRS